MLGPSLRMRKKKMRVHPRPPGARARSYVLESDFFFLFRGRLNGLNLFLHHITIYHVTTGIIRARIL